MFNLLKNIGLPELVLIALILAVIFGGQKFKEIANKLGESAKELRTVKQDIDSVKSDVESIVGGGK